MAHHMRIPDLNNATGGERQFPRRRYYGFLIGPGFRTDGSGFGVRGPAHDLVVLDNLPGGGTAVLRPGMILPVDGAYESEPTITRVRNLKNVEGGETCHVIGLTCEAELALTPPVRAPWARRQATSQASTETLVVPFAGRRHVRWVCEVTGADSVTVTVFGRTFWGSGSSDYHVTTLDAGTLCTTGTTTGSHEGGTDSEEILDQVVIVSTPASATAWKTSVDVVGELG